MAIKLLIPVEFMCKTIKAVWANTSLIWYFSGTYWYCTRQKKSRTLLNVTGSGNTKDEAFEDWRKASGVGP